jgi:hypothetical protein
MRQMNRYLASLVAFLGLVLLAGACSGGVEGTRKPESSVANKETQQHGPILIVVKPDPAHDTQKHPSGHIVSPGKPTVNRNQRIQWRNETGDKIVIQIPDERIFGVPVMKVVENGVTWKGLVVDADAPSGEYEYTIYLYKNHKHADANSNPRILIP